MESAYALQSAWPAPGTFCPKSEMYPYSNAAALLARSRAARQPFRLLRNKTILIPGQGNHLGTIWSLSRSNFLSYRILKLLLGPLSTADRGAPAAIVRLLPASM